MRMKTTAAGIVLFLIPCLLNASYWQQKVLYDINVTLSDTSHEIIGHESITYINHSPDDLSYIWMHLWPNAYKNNETPLGRQKFRMHSTKMHFFPDSSFGWIDISEVRANGDSIRWTYRSEDTLDVAKFTLNEALLSGDTLILDLDFRVKLPNSLSRLSHTRQHYEFTQWYPKPAVYDRSGWHPMSYLDQGEFYSEWGDFDVTITLPANYRVAATGKLQDSLEIAWRDSLAAQGNSLLDSIFMDPKPDIVSLDTLIEFKPISSDSMKTITFHQSRVHDFAWVADKRFTIMSDSVRLPSGHLVQVWTYALPHNFEIYKFSNDYAKEALRYFSDWFIEYPYDNVTIADVDASAGGGMEYPTITLINSINFQPFMEMAIMHEVGHNWFYGLSGSNERDFPWIDEGLVTYAENRYWQTKYPDDRQLAHTDGKLPLWVKGVDYLLHGMKKSDFEDMNYYLSAGPGLDQPATLSSEEFSAFNYGLIAYKKVGRAMETLHAYLGDAMMDSVWHTYFREWAFKHPQPGDVRQVFEATTAEDLSWFFDDMLASTARIDYALEGYQSQVRGSSIESTVKIHNRGTMNPPVPIGITGEKGEYMEKWVRPLGEHDVFHVTTDFPVKSIALDPKLKLLDLNRSNNHKELKLKFDLAQFDLNSQGDYPVMVLPYIWYNSFDHLYPGLILTHNNILPWSGFDWYLRTFYGFRTNKMGAIASLKKTFYPSGGREKTIYSRINSNWFFRLAELRFSSRVRDRILTEDYSRFTYAILGQDIFDGSDIVAGDTLYYLDNNIWDNGGYLSLKIDYSKKVRRTLWSRRLGVTGKLGIEANSTPYGKIQAYWNHNSKFSRKGSVDYSVFAGVAAGPLPAQERFYISTNIDPEMDLPYFFSRRDQWYAPGHVLDFPDDYTIPGYIYDSKTGVLPSTEAIFGGKVTGDIPKLENLSLILGAGVAHDDAEHSMQWLGSLTAALNTDFLSLYYTPFTLDKAQMAVDWTRVQVALNLINKSLSIGI